MESEIKRDKTEINISFWSWRKGEQIRTREKRKEKKKKKKKITGMEFEYGYMPMGVWKSSFSLDSLDTWFRTLYLVYGLGLGTPKLISCRVELRRALRLLDMCFEKGLVTS